MVTIQNFCLRQDRCKHERSVSNINRASKSNLQSVVNVKGSSNNVQVEFAWKGEVESGKCARGERTTEGFIKERPKYWAYDVVIDAVRTSATSEDTT